MWSFGYILPTRVFIECVEPRLAIRSLRMIDQRSRAHVNPLCDETYFRRASPISDSFSDGSGFRHSVSRSYNSNPSMLIQDLFREAQNHQDVWVAIDKTYLDGEIFVNLYRLAEYEDVLHEI